MDRPVKFLFQSGLAVEPLPKSALQLIFNVGALVYAGPVYRTNAHTSHGAEIGETRHQFTLVYIWPECVMLF